jgi:chromosome segregation ATPase
LQESKADGDDGTDAMVAVIRKVTLALANRIRDLEKEQKSLNASAARLKKDVAAEKKLTDDANAHYQTACHEIKLLEDRARDLSAQMTAMITAKEYDSVKGERDAAINDVHTLQSEMDKLQREHRATRGTLEQALVQVGSRDQMIASFHKANEERTEELNTMQGYLRRKAADILVLEKDRAAKHESIIELQKAIDTANTKIRSLTAKNRAIENELKETGVVLHRLQTLNQTLEQQKLVRL